MNPALFDTHGYDRASFDAANVRFGHDIRYLEPRLTGDTAALAAGSTAVCSFVDDRIDAAALETLWTLGVRLIALRSAGYNQVDLVPAAARGFRVVRVPDYS